MMAGGFRLSSFQTPNPDERDFLVSRVPKEVLNKSLICDKVSIPELMDQGADDIDCPGHRSILRTRTSEISCS